MPVYMSSVNKIPIEFYFAFFMAVIAVALTWVFVPIRILDGSIMSVPLVLMSLVFSYATFLFGTLLYSSPPKDIVVASISIDSKDYEPYEFLVSDTKERRLLYRGKDIEKTVDGKQYYLFSIERLYNEDDVKRLLVVKYNEKYSKSITQNDINMFYPN